MAAFDAFLTKRVGRRRFLQLAALATATGTVASLGGRSARAARAPDLRPAPSAPLPIRADAQYGRARGRYPVAGRR